MADPDEEYVDQGFTAVNYPWILDTQSKSNILLMDSREKMKGEIDKEIMKSILENPFSQSLGSNFAFLYMEVDRNQLVLDTLNALVREDINFRKPLKVKFLHEPGVDEGGVQKEFFQLLTRQLFDPSYNMFKYHEDTRLFWFNGDTFETNIKFELVGILMGIAIYNSVILDLHLPMACYKKLLGIQPDLEDLREIEPKVAESLEFIMKCEDEDLEEKLY